MPPSMSRPKPRQSLHWTRPVFIIASFLVAMLILAATRTALSAPNTPPDPPVITEPLVDGQIVSPSDVHMETNPMSDPDGDQHDCSDWQIMISDTLDLVWETICIGGVEKVHTHLGDGLFQGVYSGFTELEYDTDYIMQVRHIDDNGEISPWSQRIFRTGPATQQYPMELDNILSSPPPAWVDAAGTAVILPAGTPQPFMRVESAAADLFLEIAGFDGTSNLVTNPPPLATHEFVRIRIFAGDSGTDLVLPETDLVFVDGSGSPKTIYLPTISLPPSQTLYFWVAADGSTYVGTAAQTEPDFSQLARGAPVPWLALQAGYKVEVVATGFQLPVHIAFVPEGVYPGNPDDPYYYVTELYGTIKAVARDGTIYDYATDLLNFNPTGNFPGSGEQGVTGVVVDPATGDVFASMLYSSVPNSDTAPHYPKVVRFQSLDGGLSASSQTTILDMVGESQGQSHQISKLTIGPDNKLYVHMGDGFNASAALDLDSFRGKILRLNLDGSAPPDNPLYTGAGGARDYIYAWGFRNPFGGAWRNADGALYEVENGPSVDRFARVISNTSYGWAGSNSDMYINAIYNWSPSHAPVDMAFVQPGTFGGSGFPAERMDHAFVTESGPTWASGPQSRGKRIVEFVLDGAGNMITGPVKLVEYNGSGKATAAGLAAGPDGLYFADLYKDMGYVSPIDVGANILRIRFVGTADFAASPRVGPAPMTVVFTDTSNVPNPVAWEWDFGDGHTSTLQNPTHTYTQTGAFDVRLRVTGSEGISVILKPGYVLVGEVGTGAGVMGQYYTFAGNTPPTDPFQNLVLERIDPTINFDWQGSSPDPPLPDDYFSVRWSGSVEPLYTEDYTFYTYSDDGIRMYVDGDLVVDDWSDHGPRERSGQISLRAGQRVDIEVHFYENAGEAVASISWESASQAKEIIPTDYLYPPADLAISKLASSDPVGVGRFLTYTLVVTNHGPYSATAVTVSDTLPAGMTFAAGAGCDEANGVVECQIGQVGLNDSGSTSFIAHVPLTASGWLTNRAAVSSDSFDHVAGNNETSLVTAVDSSAPPHIYVASFLAVCNLRQPCTDNLAQALATVADNGRITILDNYTVDSSLSSGNGGLHTVRIEGPGTLTWDGSFGEAMFFVYEGNVTFDGVSMEAIAPGTAVSVVGGGALTLQNSLNSVTGFDTAVQMAGSGTAVVKGVRFNGNLTTLAQSSGVLTAYANSIEGFNVPFAHTGGEYDLQHNWWGTYADLPPAGLDAATWATRLGAPVENWAEGDGSASLGAAQVNGGGGTAVIVSHGRVNAPFGADIAAKPALTCSAYYDFFTVDGSGTWQVTVPVDDHAACNENTRDARRLFWMPERAACPPAAGEACWQLLPGVSIAGQNLVVSGLSVADLDGTPFTAGDEDGPMMPTIYLPVMRRP